MTKSTITREWLQQTIAELESVRDEIPFGIDTNSELELAAFKIALAAMDSEPVAQDEREAFEAFMAKRFGGTVNQHRANNGDRGYVAWDMVVAWIVWQARAAMLQAEPVTTACKLPPNSFTDDELEGMAHGDNPQSNAYRELLAYRRNSPVIPDTWIPVSEQMPENDESKPIAIFTGKCLGQGIFVATYDDNGFFDFWEGMEIIGVTHWMPLPAAPQEVNHG